MYFELEEKGYKWFNGSRPLLSRSGCISQQTKNRILEQEVLVPFYRGAVVFVKGVRVLIDANNEFSSPFIEERLYLGANK